MLPMFALLRDLERLSQLNVVAGRPSDLDAGTRLDWPARLDVYRRDDTLHISVDVPGVSRDDIDLTFDDDTIVIRAERRCDPDPTDEVVRLERPYGTFCRTVRVGPNFDATAAAASLRDGVLRLAVPVRPRPAASTIPISDDQPETT